MAKVKFDSKKLTAQMRKALTRELKRDMPRVLEKAIVEDNILKGKSPVKGKGRYKKYSDGYKKFIKQFGKRARPVNLKLSGQMLSTFFVKVTRRGIDVGFKDKLADIHNRQGAGKSKVIRRMLPTRSGEVFNRSISDSIRKALEKALKRIVRTN